MSSLGKSQCSRPLSGTGHAGMRPAPGSRLVHHCRRPARAAGGRCPAGAGLSAARRLLRGSASWPPLSSSLRVPATISELTDRDATGHEHRLASPLTPQLPFGYSGASGTWAVRSRTADVSPSAIALFASMERRLGSVGSECPMSPPEAGSVRAARINRSRASIDSRLAPAGGASEKSGFEDPIEVESSMTEVIVQSGVSLDYYQSKAKHC